jgi:hypothetical protein
VPGRDPETADPVHVEATLRAVEGEVLELTFQIRLHLEQFQPKHLGVRHEQIGPVVPDLDRLVNEIVGLGCLLGDGVGGQLKNLPPPDPSCPRLPIDDEGEIYTSPAVWRGRPRLQGIEVIPCRKRDVPRLREDPHM